MKWVFLCVCFYHSHLREVDQVVLGVVRCSLLNEGQVRQIHPQVGDAGRITAVKEITQVHMKKSLHRQDER